VSWEAGFLMEVKLKFSLWENKRKIKIYILILYIGPVDLR
jgi:hypothetical protein